MTAILATVPELLAITRTGSALPGTIICVRRPLNAASSGYIILATRQQTLLQVFDPLQEMTHHVECVRERGLLPVVDVTVAPDRYSHAWSLEPGELTPIIHVFLVGLALHVFAHIRTLVAGGLR